MNLKTSLVIVILMAFFSRLLGNSIDQKSSSDTTKIIIENMQEKTIGFYADLSPDLNFPFFISKKKYDTLLVFSSEPFRLQVNTVNIYNQVVFASFILHPNETIYVNYIKDTLSATSPNDTIRTNELAFFIEMQATFGNFEGFTVGIDNADKPFSYRLEKIKGVYEKRSDFLSEYTSRKHVSDFFKQYVASIFYYKQYYNFCIIYAEDDDKKNLISENKEVIQFLQEFDPDKINIKPIDFYQAVWAISMFKYLRDDDYKKYLDYIRNRVDNKTLDYITYGIIEIGTKSIQIPEIIEKFLVESSTEPIKEYVSKEFSDFIGNNFSVKMNTSDSSSVFMNLENGEFISWEELVNIKELKYIDFWASWCAPCRGAFRFSKKLEFEYQNKEIRFMYVSIDELSNVWSKVSAKENLNPKNSFLLINPNETYIKKIFAIDSIPRYMIVDKGGKIINSNAPPPSDPKLKEVLDELLKE